MLPAKKIAFGGYAVEELVCLKKFNSRDEAEMAKSILTGSEIETVVAANDAGGWYPFFDVVAGVRLMVRQEDLERAREILNEAGKGETEENR